jgi:hypothetical protein
MRFFDCSTVVLLSPVVFIATEGTAQLAIENKKFTACGILEKEIKVKNCRVILILGILLLIILMPQYI